jgi:pyrroline-5-carboxylate reductase
VDPVTWSKRISVRYVEAYEVTEMELELYREVSIVRDMPDEDLRAGDVATLVDFAAHPHGGEAGAVLEVFNALGESISVITVPISAIAPLRADQVPAVRTVSRAA